MAAVIAVVVVVAATATIERRSGRAAGVAPQATER